MTYSEILNNFCCICIGLQCHKIWIDAKLSVKQRKDKAALAKAVIQTELEKLSFDEMPVLNELRVLHALLPQMCNLMLKTGDLFVWRNSPNLEGYAELIDKKKFKLSEQLFPLLSEYALSEEPVNVGKNNERIYLNTRTWKNLLLLEVKEN